MIYSEDDLKRAVKDCLTVIADEAAGGRETMDWLWSDRIERWRDTRLDELLRRAADLATARTRNALREP